MPVLMQSAGRRGELSHEHVTPRRVKLEGGGRIRIRAHPRDIEPSDVMAHVEDCLQGGDDDRRAGPPLRGRLAPFVSVGLLRERHY